MSDLYEVIIARYGNRDTLRSDVYLNYPLYGVDDAPIGMDYFVWVVRNEERTILVDTGFSAESGGRRGRHMLISPVSVWEALGILPESAPLIVITHAHYDHTGHLAHFPSSRIVIAEQELAFWRSQTSQELLFRHSAEGGDLEAIDRAVAEGRVDAFGDRLEVAPGVEVIRVGGHTPGQAVVLVQTSEGPVLLASDAVHYYEEYESHMPFMSVADLVQMYGAFDLISSWVADGTVAHVVSGHDPDTLTRFPPLGGVLAGNAAIIGGAR